MRRHGTHCLIIMTLFLGATIATLPAQTTEKPPPIPLPAGLSRAPGGQEAGDDGEVTRTIPARTAAQEQVSEPQDPDRLRGTYVIDGREVPVTEGEFYRQYLLIKPHEERNDRPLRATRVLEQILLMAEVEALGCVISDEELARSNPLKSSTDPAMAEQIRARWDAMGLTEEMVLEYLRQARSIDRLKALYANSVRVTSEEVYDLWKRDNFLYRMAYILFPAEKYERELRATTPDEATLKLFWETNPQVQNKFRTPTTVSADLLVFDPRSVSDADLARMKQDRPIPYEDALAWYRLNKDRLDSQVPSSERPKLFPRGAVPLEEVVTPFELLRPQIEREILLGDRIEQAFEKASANPGFDAAELARAHGLRFRNIERMDQVEATREMGAFGPEFFAHLFNSEMGRLAGEIVRQGGLQYFWRLREKTVSALPTFAEALERGLLEEWYLSESYERALAAAREIEEQLDASASEANAEQETRIDAEMADAAQKEIEARNVSDANQVDLVRSRYAASAQAQKVALRAGHKGRHLDELVASREDLELVEMKPFSFMPGQPQATPGESSRDRMESFLRSNYGLRNLEAGSVSRVVSDVIGRNHGIVKVIGREEPPFEAMTATEYQQRANQIERQKVLMANHRWTLPQLQVRREWKEN